MSEISPEDYVKKALGAAITNLLFAREDVAQAKRELTQKERQEDVRETEARRLHDGYVALNESAEKDFIKYLREFKQANPQ